MSLFSNKTLLLIAIVILIFILITNDDKGTSSISCGCTRCSS